MVWGKKSTAQREGQREGEREREAQRKVNLTHCVIISHRAARALMGQEGGADSKRK